MSDLQPNMNEIVSQMIRKEIQGCIGDIRNELVKEILIEEKAFLTMDNFSDLTGLKKSTIYKYCSQGKIGHYRPTGKQTFFTWGNIKEFILNEKCYNPAKSEIRRRVHSEYILNKM